MLLIIAHHYVVNSGLVEKIAIDPLSANSLFYLLFGAWGKTGINCFVLITGYFMCKSQISLRKFLKLFLWSITYSVIIALIFTLCGYHPGGLLKMWVYKIPFLYITDGFGTCFLVFYLCIPFINKLIQSITQKQHLLLIALLLFIYSLHESLPGLKVTMNYVSWFSVIYIISSYFRMYPSQLYNNKRFWGWATLISWGTSILSILLFTYLQNNIGAPFSLKKSYYLLSDSNAVLALTNGITSFLFFKNLNIKHSTLINTLAASSFGVLLIHANSDVMRLWLWKDLVNCVDHYSGLWVYPICSVLLIYIVCSVIDMVRIKTIERPLLDYTEGLCTKAILSIKRRWIYK